ncbi:transcriptional regulator [Geomonas limicola]|uniref:Transcriptional regulator n=2 Tax=Geomonas limicola TaxID=2740186 RepID=A0A6V8N692_9BACT|nr:transcriptional regulator [Geomonas limicola]
MTIGERLKSVRGETSQDEAAKLLGVHKNTLGKYERGERVPDAEFLVVMLETFPEIDPAWLLTGEGAKLREKTGYRSAEGVSLKSVAIQKEGLGPDEYVKVARYDVHASAGAGALVANEQIVDYIQFKPDWIKTALGASAKNLALISVKGDSMEPTLSDGDIVMVDTSDKQFEANAIYVLQNWGSLLVKRIQRKIDGTVVIKSDNQAYEPETVRGDLVEQLHVVGRVVWYGRRG